MDGKGGREGKIVMFSEHWPRAFVDSVREREQYERLKKKFES